MIAADLARAVGAAAAELRRAFAALVESVDPVTSPADDAAELIVAVKEVTTMAAALRAAGDERVLDWLRDNAAKAREVVIGDLKYFGARDKKERFRDAPNTFVELARMEYGASMLTAVFGDEDALEAVLRHVERLAEDVLSAHGLKAGAVKEILTRAAVATLPPGSGREAEEEAARVEIEAHIETEWGDKLDDGPPAKKLGVANVRFVEAAQRDRAKRAALAGGGS